MKDITNYAFIDGQNLHLGTAKEGWQVDFRKFRVYLQDKFNVSHAYFFMGFKNMPHGTLYIKIQEAGFILIFKDFNEFLASKKKGNVDCDLVFHIMRGLYKKENFNKVVLVSGDGDFFRLVIFLIEEGRFERVLFPNREYSSLYKKIKNTYGVNLSLPNVRSKIELKKNKKEGVVQKH